MAVKTIIDMIEGFADMSTEDKIKAVEGLTFDDHSEELEKQKAATSKANSEAAEWKKKHNSLLSEDEQKRQADQEKLKEILEENQKLKREKSITNLSISLMKQGYTDELALSTATAMCDGDTATVLKNREAFNDAFKKKIIAEAMGGSNYYPAGGSQTSGVDYQKQIEEAQSRGDLAGAAALIRLSQQVSQTSKK